MNKPFALIVEDDPQLGNIFTLALETADFVSELIADGELAQRRLKEIAPDVIVLDLHLPNVSGELLLQQIKADERLAQSRVIVVTADARMGGYLRKQTDLLLLKPISPTQLRDLAKRLRPTSLTSQNEGTDNGNNQILLGGK